MIYICSYYQMKSRRLESNSQSDSDRDNSSSSSSSSQIIQVNSEQSYDLLDQNIYAVEKILDKRIRFGKPQYLIKWKDWDLPQHNTWEGMENLKMVTQLVKDFQKQYNNRNPGKTKLIKKNSKQTAQDIQKNQQRHNITHKKSLDNQKYKQIEKHKQVQQRVMHQKRTQQQRRQITQRQKQKQIQRQKQRSRQLQKQRQRQRQQQRQGQRLRQQQRQRQRQRQKLRERERQIQRDRHQRQRIKQRQKQTQRQKQLKKKSSREAQNDRSRQKYRQKQKEKHGSDERERQKKKQREAQEERQRRQKIRERNSYSPKYQDKHQLRKVASNYSNNQDNQYQKFITGEQPTTPSQPVLKKNQSLVSIPTIKSITSDKNQLENKPTSQKSNNPPRLSIGGICKYLIQGKSIFYEVDIVDQKSRIIGVKKVSSSELRTNNAEKLRKYLEEELVQIDRYQQFAHRLKLEQY